MTVVRIRRATSDDAAAIAEVHVTAWRAAYQGVVPQGVLDGLSVAHREAFWQTTADDDEKRVWVVERDGQILGFASAGPARDDDLAPRTGELYAIYLHPDAWGQGVGGPLLGHAVHDLAGRGLAPLVLWVLTDNDRARSFYGRHGWQPDGEARLLDFAGTPVEEMRLRLRTSRPPTAHTMVR